MSILLGQNTIILQLSHFWGVKDKTTDRRSPMDYRDYKGNSRRIIGMSGHKSLGTVMKIIWYCAAGILNFESYFMR